MVEWPVTFRQQSKRKDTSFPLTFAWEEDEDRNKRQDEEGRGREEDKKRAKTQKQIDFEAIFSCEHTEREKTIHTRLHNYDEIWMRGAVFRYLLNSTEDRTSSLNKQYVLLDPLFF